MMRFIFVCILVGCVYGETKWCTTTSDGNKVEFTDSSKCNYQNNFGWSVETDNSGQLDIIKFYSDCCNTDQKEHYELYMNDNLWNKRIVFESNNKMKSLEFNTRMYENYYDFDFQNVKSGFILTTKGRDGHNDNTRTFINIYDKLELRSSGGERFILNYRQYPIPFVNISWSGSNSHAVRINSTYAKRDKCYYAYNCKESHTWEKYYGIYI